MSIVLVELEDGQFHLLSFVFDLAKPFRKGGLEIRGMLRGELLLDQLWSAFGNQDAPSPINISDQTYQERCNDWQEGHGIDHNIQ